MASCGTRVRWDHGLCVMWAVSDSEWFDLQRIALLLPPPHAPESGSQNRLWWKCFISASRAGLDLTGTLFFPIKNVLFLAHCVKTRLSHPVYACAHWNNFPSPEGSSGLFSYMCWSPRLLCFTLHADPLRNPVHQPWGHRARMVANYQSLSPRLFPFSSLSLFHPLCSFLSSCFSR